MKAKKSALPPPVLHEQKMEALCRLAGSLAHDLNNILTGIVGYGHLLKMKMPENDRLRVYADNILSLSDRAISITEALLTLSGRKGVELKEVNVNDIIRDAFKVLSQGSGEATEVKTVLTARNARVMADVPQMQRVLLNLATNARDAMPEGGRLTIKTEIAETGNEAFGSRSHGDQGMFAVISVTDTGTGMDEITKERIFDPFYTTKEVGKGTGLGLSLAYGIIAQHHGHITVDTKQGKGTTVSIYLPLIKAG